MKVRYYPDTDTLYLEFRATPVAESRDLDENTVVDLDSGGQVCAMTSEDATQRAALPDLSVERVGSGSGAVSLRLRD